MTIVIILYTVALQNVKVSLETFKEVTSLL